MRRAGRWMLGLGLSLTVLAPGGAWLLSAVAGRDLLMITPHSAQMVVVNRLTWSLGEPVAPIYGNPTSEVTRVLFATPDRVLTPVEDSSLSLLLVSPGEYVVQMKSVWYVVPWLTGFGAFLAIAGGMAMRSRSVEPASSASP